MMIEIYEEELPNVSSDKHEMIILKFSEWNENGIILIRNYSVLLKHCARICVALDEVRHSSFEFLVEVLQRKEWSLLRGKKNLNIFIIFKIMMEQSTPLFRLWAGAGSNLHCISG